MAQQAALDFRADVLSAREPASVSPDVDPDAADAAGEEAQWPPSSPEDAACLVPVMRLFQHHVYEYGRGVRALFLMTLNRKELPAILTRLARQGIAHFVQEVSPAKVNLFFGREAFVAVARAVVTRPLNTLSPEEDFMLGTLLGYDREQQCRRYLCRSGRGGLERVALAAE